MKSDARSAGFSAPLLLARMALVRAMRSSGEMGKLLAASMAASSTICSAQKAVTLASVPDAEAVSETWSAWSGSVTAARRKEEPGRRFAEVPFGKAAVVARRSARGAETTREATGAVETARTEDMLARDRTRVRR